VSVKLAKRSQQEKGLPGSRDAGEQRHGGDIPPLLFQKGGKWGGGALAQQYQK